MEFVEGVVAFRLMMGEREIGGPVAVAAAIKKNVLAIW